MRLLITVKPLALPGRYDLVLKGDDKAIRAKIIKGTSVNLRNDNDQTRLHYAMFYNQVKIAKFLIEVGADLDAKDKFGQTVRDVIPKHNSELYGQSSDKISKFSLQTEQENVAEHILGCSEDNSACNIL